LGSDFLLLVSGDTLSKKQVVRPKCPVCEQTDQTIKLSRVYLEAIAADRKKTDFQDNNTDPLPFELDPKFLTKNLRRFTPPSGKTELIRMVHPDWTAGAFSLLALFFLYQMFTTQIQSFYIGLGLFVVAYALYFIFRKKIIARYTQRKTSEEEDKKNIEQSIGRWMRLYYCVRDDIVFEPGKKEFAALDNLDAFILNKK
jgi:hypothetical protein